MPPLPLTLLRAFAALALCASAAAAAAAAQGTAPRPGDQRAPAKTAGDRSAGDRAAGGPVIGCTSLANLRSLLRSTGEDHAAALAIVSDPKSDLGCSPVDRAAVTEVADHLALNGRAYDCLALKSTAVCHWTVAGAVTPAARPSAKPARGKEAPGKEAPSK